MPALPPWLTPARPAPLYATGLGLGLRAAEQQTAAAQRAQQLAAQAAAQQNEAMLQSERMAVQQQIAEQEMGLKAQQLGLSRQELAQAEAMNQFKIDEASRLASARGEFARRVAAGEPVENVLAEMGPLVDSDPAFAALIRERAAPEATSLSPEEMLTAQPYRTQTGETVPGHLAIRSATGKGFVPLSTVPAVPEMTESARTDRALKVRAAIDNLYEKNPMLDQDQPDPKWSETRKKSWQRSKASLKFYEDQLSALQGGLTRTGSAALNQNVLPFPKSKDEAITGQLYQTKLGIMEWNGTKFVAPSTSTQSDY